MTTDAAAASTGGTERLLSAPLASQIAFLTARAGVLGAVVTNERLREFGLRVRSYAVLSLACGGLGPTQRQLAEFLRLDPSQIVSLVDGLEAAGLVERQTDPSDRRSKVIVATPHGEAVQERAAVAAAESEAVVLAELDAGERDQLRTILAKVAFAAVDGDH